MWPNGDSASPGLLAAVAADAATVFRDNGLSRDLHVAHAMRNSTSNAAAAPR